MNKILLVITTYNQLKYTKLCVKSIQNLKENIDLLVIDDFSTDGTDEWLAKKDISSIIKRSAKGLTDSWNIAYKQFKENKDYKYLIIANNDILIPQSAIAEMEYVADKWNYSVTVPLSSEHGAGHNGKIQGIEKFYEIDTIFVNNPNNFQQIQQQLLSIKEKIKKQNNLFTLDPHRLKMFNGFFFMLSRKIIDYELDNGFIFDDTKPLYKAEDEFNWSILIPNNDNVALCRTSFIFHFKGMSTKEFSMEHNDVNVFVEKRMQLDKRKGNGE